MTSPLAAVTAEYAARHPRSEAAHRRALQSLPGGDSRSTLYFAPFPLFFTRADGSRLTDLDDHELIDFSGNHSVLVHGGRPATVVAAVTDQLQRGLCFAGPVPTQVDFAEALTARIASLDLVRFCNSGTEATLNATRAARAFTGRSVVAKAEGAYHGSQDDMFVSTHPTPAEAGSADRPVGVPRSAGLGRAALEDTLVVPFNRVAAAEGCLRDAGADLAAVFVEPIQGSAGMIPAEPDYLRMLRDVCDDTGALLVADEVVSLRVAAGGMEEWAGVRPDLTCLGKMIGGGLPLGVWGGRGDVMDLFDPRHGPVVAHPGSLNANPLSLQAGAAALAALTPERIAAANDRGEQLAGRVRAIASAHGAPITVTGRGSLQGMHYAAGPVREFRDTWREDREAGHAVFLGLLCEGIVIDPRGAICISTALDDGDVELFAGALDRVLTLVYD